MKMTVTDALSCEQQTQVTEDSVTAANASPLTANSLEASDDKPILSIPSGMGSSDCSFFAVGEIETSAEADKALCDFNASLNASMASISSNSEENAPKETEADLDTVEGLFKGEASDSTVGETDLEDAEEGEDRMSKMNQTKFDSLSLGEPTESRIVNPLHDFKSAAENDAVDNDNVEFVHEIVEQITTDFIQVSDETGTDANTSLLTERSASISDPVSLAHVDTSLSSDTDAVSGTEVATFNEGNVEDSKIKRIDNDGFIDDPLQINVNNSLLSTWSLNKNNDQNSLKSCPPRISASSMNYSKKNATNIPATTKSKSADSQDSADSKSDTDLLRGWSRDEGEEEKGMAKLMRKAGVAVTGGALVVAGIPMIPMPTPGGVVVVGSGMALLATEFPAAQRALDKSREGLANIVGDESDDDEDKKEKKKKIAKVADMLFEEEEGKKKSPNKFFKQMSNSLKKKPSSVKSADGATTPKKKAFFADNEEMTEIRDKTVNAAKGAKKNVKKFIRGTVLPLMERITSKSESRGISSKSQRGEIKPSALAGPLRPRLGTK